MSRTDKNWYWLKLVDDFFDQREMKKLRMIAGGDTYTIIYLKLQLLSLRNSGMIYFEKTEKDIYEQLHFELDEKIDDIKMTILYLEQNNLIEIINDDLEFIRTKELIGVTTAGALRVARHRAKKKQEELVESEKKALHCNNSVTLGNVEIELEIEKEIELEKELEKELELESDEKHTENTPTLAQVNDIFNSLKLKSNPVKFYSHYDSTNWTKLTGHKITLKNLKLNALAWERREIDFAPTNNSTQKKYTNGEGEKYNTSEWEI